METTTDIWPDFERDFWPTYDKFRGKIAALKWWNKLTQKEKEDCMAAVQSYVAATPNKVYRKDPERYLRHKAFYDEVIAPTRPTANDYTIASASALARKLADRQGR